MEWVRYVVGHPYDDGEPAIDVPIRLPKSTEMRSRPEVFAADEAAELFMAYHKTGDIPAGYVLRPVEGYTSDDKIVDLRRERRD